MSPRFLRGGEGELREMKEPLVSILIPAYNAQPWCVECIKSAIAQTWRRKEVIIVDDGSSDGTLAVAERFAGPDVRVVRQAHQGASAARNLAYSLCQGDYVQWLDADDLLQADKIEKQVHAIRDGVNARTLLSGAWASFHYRTRKAVYTPTTLWSDLSPVEWLTRKMAGALHMQPDSWLVSRELSDAAGPWDVTLWRDNDGEYFCRVLMASSGVRFVPGARSYYRAAGFRSISYIGGSDRKLESLCRSIKLHIRYLLSMEDSQRTRDASIEFVSKWLTEFYPYRPSSVRS